MRLPIQGEFAYTRVMGESAFHPEDRERSLIDRRLVAYGWLIQSKANMNLGAGLRVAVREFQTASGPVDYGKLLDTLSKHGGIIGAIFLKAQNEIQDPAKLRRLVGLIDSEVWLGLPMVRITP